MSSTDHHNMKSYINHWTAKRQAPLDEGTWMLKAGKRKGKAAQKGTN